MSRPGRALGLAVAVAGALGCAGVGAEEGGPAPSSPAAHYPALAPAPPPAFTPTGPPGRFLVTIDATTFQKGNIHTHSRESDGDSPPEAVYTWYRDHGYNFLALSDHNRLTDPARYRQLERPGFVILPAEEITMSTGVPVHVNAICERARIGSMATEDLGDALSWAVRRTLEEGGVAMVNHPNFKWAFGAEALPSARGAHLLEIWSGHPQVNPLGDATHASAEAIWDTALTGGLDLAPAGVDDMHVLGAGRGDRRHAGPGRGWIDVMAANPTEAEICDALRKRRVIASSGVRLRRLHVEGDALEVAADAPGAVVEFIGARGALLERQPIAAGAPNTYRLRGGEGYVRARVIAPGGARAWTPAYRIDAH